jgi:uncharacterized protein YycO
MIHRIPSILLVGLLASCSGAAEIKDGDIIFHRSKSRQATAIAAATKSDYTHMGIIFFSDGSPYVYEAIQPVTRTPLKDWITRGVGEHYVIKRLKDSSKVDFSKAKEETKKLLGRDYDWLFDWSDKRIYCSELVWKAYKRAAGVEIVSLRKLRDFDLTSEPVRKLMQERYGKNIPLDMDVIAPSDIFSSPKLITIEDK